MGMEFHCSRCHAKMTGAEGVAPEHCPKCKADQRPHWITPDPAEMEGRDWHCPNCRATLMMLLGQITEVHVPRPSKPGGGSPLPPAPPRR